MRPKAESNAISQLLDELHGMITIVLSSDTMPVSAEQ